MAEDDGCAASLATGEGVGMAEDDGCAALLATGKGLGETGDTVAPLCWQLGED